jgi:hypothetical protein
MSNSKILFLDIDGVLNSTKTAVANKGYPYELHEQDKFDQVSIKLIRNLCEVGDISIVLSSMWRLHFSVHDVANAFDLPVIDSTSKLGHVRGKQIDAWLKDHPEVTQYAIIDDDADMLTYQMERFVKTDGHEGVTWKDFQKLCGLFDVKPFDCTPPSRNAILEEKKEVWTPPAPTASSKD